MTVLVEWKDGKTTFFKGDRKILQMLMHDKSVKTIMDAETCAIIYEK